MHIQIDMNRYNARNITINLVFKAILTGLIIWLIALFSDMTFRQLTFAEIIKLRTSFPSYIVIDLIPFVFALFAYKQGTYLGKKMTELYDELTYQLKKTQRIIHFIESIKSGENTDIEEALDKEDAITQSLIGLRDTLIKNKQEEAVRKREDEQRSWINEGLAKFGDILRKNISNIENLSYEIISNLVKYLNANQGGFFIINGEEDDDIHLKMTACYAYERRKFADKRVEWGEGLVGTVVQEKESMYMENVPPSYVNITSGLGKSTPTFLAIIPLKINEEVHGTIEMASFHKFENFEIEFIEKVTESIASTISNVKINEKTARLLKESREQAETLAMNEEQMRQNMEELQAAQEEVARQSEKFISFTNTVNNTLIRAEYSIDGNLLYANTNFVKSLEYANKKQVEGKHISTFINKKDHEWFFSVWDNLKKGGKHFEGNMVHVGSKGKDLWTMATYTCMKKPDGTVEKILFLGLDATEQKQKSLNYEGQIIALDQTGIKAEFTVKEEFIDCNQNFLDALGYDSHAEIEEMKVFDFIEKIEVKDLKKHWDDVLDNKTYRGQITVITKTNDSKWFDLTLSPVKNIYEEVHKVIWLAKDISNEKRLESEIQKQQNQIKQQEKQIKQSAITLQKRLEQEKKEMKVKFSNIERIKIRNEKILEETPDAVLIINEMGIVEFFNTAAEELWEIKQDQIKGQKINMLFPEDIIEREPFIKKLVSPAEEKETGKRKKVTITTQSQKNIPVLMLIASAAIGKEKLYTAFVQKI